MRASIHSSAFLSTIVSAILACLISRGFASDGDVKGDAQDPGGLVPLIQRSLLKTVKIYGAGGVRGLESYQSGFFVSDQGHIVTSWSTVLDVDKIRVVTFDGKKWDAELVGSDPVTEMAVIKIEGDGFSYFDMNKAGKVEVGDRILAISNLFGIATGDEPNSVQRGVVMGFSSLASRRGRLKTPYQGKILVIDAMTNNPGATGGVVVNLEGRLVGALGKELRDDSSGIWLNYALPVEVVSEAVKSILEGKTIKKPAELVMAKRPHRLAALGVVMIPNVIAKTPAYIDQVTPESLAARSGLLANDLVLAVNNQRVDSRKTLEELLSTLDQADAFTLLVQRGTVILSVEVRP